MKIRYLWLIFVARFWCGFHGKFSEKTVDFAFLTEPTASSPQLKELFPAQKDALFYPACWRGTSHAEVSAPRGDPSVGSSVSPS